MLSYQTNLLKPCGKYTSEEHHQIALGRQHKASILDHKRIQKQNADRRNAQIKS